MNLCRISSQSITSRVSKNRKRSRGNEFDDIKKDKLIACPSVCSIYDFHCYSTVCRNWKPSTIVSDSGEVARGDIEYGNA